MKKHLLLVLFIISVLIFSACSNDLSNSGDGSGELALFIADKPVNDVAEVLVTISEVQVKRDDNSWETINDFADDGGEKEFDLLKLRFGESLLGQKTLPSGNYTGIRLIVAADEKGKQGHNSGKSKVVYANGDEDSIFIPSGTQSGLKINHNFSIQDRSITRLVLDSDVSKIMHAAGKSGKIILRPTAIDVLDKVISGSIEGKVVADINGDGTADEAISNADVLVQAIQGDEVISSTVALAEDSTQIIDGDEVEKEAGTFYLRGLEEGNYTIKAFVKEEADGEDEDITVDDSIYQPASISDIEVKAEETTDVGKDIVLERNVTTGSIEGNIVTDSDSGYTAITDAEVVLEVLQDSELKDKFTLEANEDKTANPFLIEDLEAGNYTLKAYGIDNEENIVYPAETRDVEIIADSNEVIDDIVLSSTQ
ncbi:MAG: DUF4382 domain-containing protein [Bacillota bacterium]